MSLEKILKKKAINNRIKKRKEYVQQAINSIIIKEGKNSSFTLSLFHIHIPC